ncbi:MAG: alginate export family protein [Candidatus Marinimicrobia bacterium]|nr:alginate export family protein [Candidatus Neomarinimicrobiota bacterium]MCH7763315.1 alginate export family protein [Candidatus Neomarinimicrobiota bacterium]
MNKYFSILTLLSLISASDFEWQAEFRYRLETEKSDSLFSTSPNTINYTRSRISLKFINGPITGFAQLQDSRILGDVFGSAGLTQSSNNDVEFHQIYFQVSQLLKRNWTLRFGRFEMPLGSERLFSKNNWNNYGRAFEGIHSFNQNKFGSLNTFYLINIENSSYPTFDFVDNISEVIQGVYFSPTMKNSLPLIFNQLDLYWYNYNYYFNDFQRVRRTIGGRWDVGILFFRLEGEYAYQNGKYGSGDVNLNINGIMSIFNLHLELSFLPFLSRLSVGKEYFSGDDHTTESLDGFANPWGEVHKYHGYFDKHTHFSNNYSAGLDEWNVKTVFTLPGGFKLSVHYHDFKDGVKSDPLGTELDIVFSKKLGFGGVLQQGFARYWEAGGDQLDYSWFMLNFTL